MTKPKELTGRAIPFIEWLSNLLCLRALLPSEQYQFVKFYSQPFTPKLLEYFEWWDDSGSFYVMKRDEEFKLYRDEEFILSFQTLSDFITLCNLAGVELNWKE